MTPIERNSVVNTDSMCQERNLLTERLPKQERDFVIVFTALVTVTSCILDDISIRGVIFRLMFSRKFYAPHRDNSLRFLLLLETNERCANNEIDVFDFLGC